MSRLLLRSLMLGACAMSTATVCFADLPSPAPQRAEGRKAQPALRAAPLTMTPAAGAQAPVPATQTASSRGIFVVGGKSAINSQPVPPGKTGPTPSPVASGNVAINSQPVPPGKPVNSVGPAARKLRKPGLSH